MTERTELERIIRCLATVLARGHRLIPVPHNDLRLLFEAAKRDVRTDGVTEDGKNG